MTPGLPSGIVPIIFCFLQSTITTSPSFSAFT